MSAVPAVGLDPGWIVERLEIDGTRPTSCTFAGFIGTGQMSRNARLLLEWGEDGDARPGSVVVKVPSADAATRAGAFDSGTYGKECHFYAQIADRVDITTPHAYLVHVEPADHDFAIVLEDLAGSAQGDQFAEPTGEQLALAVEQAAALQAPVWGRAHESVFGPLRADVDERVERFRAALPIFLATVLDRLGDDLEHDVIALLERFAAQPTAWIRASLDPVTLVHGDFRPDNFLLGVADGAPPIAVVDWQTLALGRGATDVAYLLAGALAPERRRVEEAPLLGRYVDALAGRGVDLPVDQCWEDFAVGAMHGVVIAMAATTMAEQTERGDALFTLMLNRHGRHAIELESLDRV